jgi:transcriptional regulator with XRE-family HTH domain
MTVVSIGEIMIRVVLDEFNLDIEKQLKQARTRYQRSGGPRERTVERIAKELGMTRDAYNRKERGDRPFTLKELLQVQKLFGVKLFEVSVEADEISLEVIKNDGK